MENKIDHDTLKEFHGELIRANGGFVLEATDGRRHPLELPRVPVNLVGKAVVVTGEPRGTGESIIAHYIRHGD